MKMLYILNKASQINSFCYSSILAAKKAGIEYHIAGDWGYKSREEREADEKKYGIFIHQIDFIRFPFDPRNFKAYKQLKILCVKENFDVIHCNTPIGGLLGRIVGKMCHVGYMIYQAHGFHFYKGAPKLNWLLYYPVEKWLAHYTDLLITINQEDYTLAKKKMKAKRVVYVPGVGIDLEKFGGSSVQKAEKRKELGIPEDAVILLSVGELNKNKNHETVLRAIRDLPVYYLIAGAGEKRDSLLKTAESLDLCDRLKLLGFRQDVREIYSVADAFVFPSFREGLSVALMEAMAAGLPCAVSNIRGNVDLINSNGGVSFDPRSTEGCRKALEALLKANRKSMGEYNKEKIKQFSLETVFEEMVHLYEF